MLDLDQYFKRIEFSGPVKSDYATLAAIHHQHLLHIPYENVDVQLGTPLDFDIERIFTKLVTQGRGGWCYEMNGLLGWALAEAGFEVQRMSGAVMRETQGEQARGNHLLLEVRLDGLPYLTDVGLGDGLRFPIPITEGTHTQQSLDYALTMRDDGMWRFHNHAHSNVRSFDFAHQPANETELADKCAWLQSDPTSPFKMLLIANRFTPASIEVLVGKVHTTITDQGKQSREIESVAALKDTLATTFNLHLTEDLTRLWSQICTAHEQFFSAGTVQS